MSLPRTNWAGNITYQATAGHAPASVEELRALVQRRPRVKVIATRHSFNGIGDTTADHVSLAALHRIVDLDPAARTVTIEAGVRYGELGRFLHDAGWALPNLASLPHISVAGAVATATHGSGNKLGNLATAVTALEMIDGRGEIVRLARTRDPDVFPGAVVALGALGIVTRLTLAVEPAYEVRQVVYENLPWAVAAENVEALTASATSVSLFTDWQAERFHQVWLKQRTEGRHGRDALPRELLGATSARAECHPLPGHAAENCTPQLGNAGPWHERLPHFRLEFTPSSGAELQSEYFAPRHHAPAIIRAMAALQAAIAPHVYVSEIRTIAADDLWLSPGFEQPQVALHFTWKPDWPAVQALLPQIERALAPFGVRPHWGKLSTMAPAAIRAGYRRFDDFRRLRDRFDPARKFSNAHLDALLGP